jgi:ribosomal protein L16 Arg81 hydroxylase
MATEMKPRPPSRHSVPAEWRRWVAENKMLGLDAARLIATLVDHGIDRNAAEQELASLDDHPYFQAGNRMAQRLHKLHSLLDVYADLAGLRAAARFTAIERRSNVTREEFLENYYAANRPLILCGLMNDWRACSVWSPDYFKATCGGETVEVMTERNADRRYELNASDHKSSMLFGDYIDWVTRQGRSNDRYLVANNNLLQREGMKHLSRDIVVFPEYLDPGSVDGHAFLWFGPAGTVTPLHHDAMNILIAQVFGRKRVTLIPSGQIHRLYNDIGVYSEVDCERPDAARFPDFGSVPIQRFVLRPREVLFVPVGWWHHVRALDVSVSVSFTNFVFPNSYQWRQPAVRRE